MTFEADFETVAGSELHVCATRPTADTAVAYAALTWVEVGEVTNVGGVLGREYSTSTASTVKNAHDREKKGSYKLPSAEFETLFVEDDPGQVIIAAAANTNDILAFKLVKQSGAIRYFTAQVMKFNETAGGSNDAVKASFSLLRQSDSIIA